MLFHPPAEHRLPAIQALLESWNGEADRIRTAAIIARKGERPTAAVVSAAEDAQGSLNELLVDVDRAIDAVAPGHAEFSWLLRVRVTTSSLLESIGTSLDMLDHPNAGPAKTQPDATINAA